MLSRENQVKICDSQIALSTARAICWAQFATSQANYNRHVMRDNKKLGRLELEEDAFATMNQHLSNAQNALEVKQKLLGDMEADEERKKRF